MGQFFVNVLGILVLVLFFQWNKGQKFKFIYFIVEVICVGFIFFISNRVGHYFNHHIHISIPLFNRIPSQVKDWLGATLFFIGCCALSIKSWVHFNEQKRRKNSKSP